jgi:putative transposase
MPRQKRVLSPTQVYHVMVRGNSGRYIFLDDDDKKKLLRIIFNKKRENEFILYAYCLMNNHYHLVLKEYNDNISHIMKRINTTYVVYFNKKYQIYGHLFQGRFKSEIVENDAYLLALIRYVHNNPVKAGLVSSIGGYRWSSYLSYIDSQNEIVNNDDILKFFSEDLVKARYQFIGFSQKKEEKYKFLEYKVHNSEKKEINTYSKFKNFRDQFLKRNKLNLDLISEKRNKKFLDKLIQELRKSSIYSEREIAELLNIDRGMVYRAGGIES